MRKGHDNLNQQNLMTSYFNTEEVYISQTAKFVAVDTGFSSSQQLYEKQTVLYRLHQSAIFRNYNYLLLGWIYMIDSNDAERFPEVKEDLHYLVNNYPQLQTLLLVFF